MTAASPASLGGFWRRLLGPFFGPVVAMVALTVVLVGGLAIRYAFYTSPDQAAVAAAPRIGDTSFERAANAICLQYVHVFDTETTLGDQASAGQTSRFLDSIAGTFDAMVAKLDQLPVAPADHATVAHWLDQWHAYDAFGHRYAAAVAKRAEAGLVHNDSASQGQLRRDRNAFAKANHMPSCAFN